MLPSMSLCLWPFRKYTTKMVPRFSLKKVCVCEGAFGGWLPGFPCNSWWVWTLNCLTFSLFSLQMQTRLPVLKITCRKAVEWLLFLPAQCSFPFCLLLHHANFFPLREITLVYVVSGGRAVRFRESRVRTWPKPTRIFYILDHQDDWVVMVSQLRFA